MLAEYLAEPVGICASQIGRILALLGPKPHRVRGWLNRTTFIEFLTELALSVDPTKNIHLILDNGSSHTSKQTRKWLTEHPRFTVTYTPTHASWLNMEEIFFSILTRRMLRRGDFSSRNDLADKITTFIETYNDTAKTLPRDLRRQVPQGRMILQRTSAAQHWFLLCHQRANHGRGSTASRSDHPCPAPWTQTSLTVTSG